MRPDEKQEKMHIDDIICGLDDISKIVKDETNDKDQHGLLALKLGCHAFSEICKSPFVEMAGIPWHSPAVQDVVNYAAASMDLVRAFRMLPDKKSIKSIKKHLALVGMGYFGIAASRINLQLHPSRVRSELEKLGVCLPSPQCASDASRKTIELMVGLAALRIADSVSIEDAVDSSSSLPNPDIIVNFNGSRIGIACKSLTTRNASGVRERVREGVRQITRAAIGNNPQVDTGLVLLDVSALLDHDALYMFMRDKFLCWDYRDIPGLIRRHTAGAFACAMDQNEMQMASVHDLFSDLFKRPFSDLFESAVNPVSEPCILVYGHSVMIGSDGIEERPIYAKVLLDYFHNDQSRITGFVKELNKSLHGQ